MMIDTAVADSTTQLSEGRAAAISPAAVTLPPTYSIDVTHLVREALAALPLIAVGAPVS